MLDNIVFVAFLWGAFSAVSLPLGSWLGIKWRPDQKMNSTFMAFGAGALLFALTIELFAHVPHHVDKHGNWAFIAVVGGALLGGMLFDFLNNRLNNRGAFIRKFSSAKRYVAQMKLKRAKKMLKKIGVVPAFHLLPPDKVAMLFQYLVEETVEKDTPVFRQGDDSKDLYFIMVFEGLAAGAMLTMIAETMLPEAFEQGGFIVGMATLLGFLSALVIKVYG